MPDTTLTVQTGRPTGSAAARRMRRDDVIPAVVYGRGMEPISVSVGRRDLRLALSGPAGMNTVLDLSVDGTTLPAIVKEIQRHPVRRTVQHVDFLQVDLNEEIKVSVPLRLEGEASEVLANNGLVDPAVDSIEVQTTPRNIPDEIVIDVSSMTMDTVIQLGDITLPDGVVATADPETVLVTVLVMRGVDEPTAEGDEAEGEGDEAAGDEATDGEGEATDADAAGDAE